MTDRLELLDGFRERLRRAMEIRGYSKADLGRACFTSRQNITHVLAPERKPQSRKKGPTLWYVVKLAKVLRVDPGWLAFGNGNPPEALK